MSRLSFTYLVTALAWRGVADLPYPGRRRRRRHRQSAAQDDATQNTTCGVRTGQRGKTNRTIKAAGLDRTYIVYLPADVDPTTADAARVRPPRLHDVGARRCTRSRATRRSPTASTSRSRSPTAKVAPTRSVRRGTSAPTSARRAASRRTPPATTSRCSTRSRPTSRSTSASIATTSS